VIAGARVVAVAGGAAALGFAHRRLKRFAWVKPLYLTGSWTAVTVGLPAAGVSVPLDLARLGFTLAIVASTVQANVVLSNLRDAEGIAGRVGARPARGVAGAFCAAALGLALLGPSELRALAALPLAMSVAVVAFRSGERFGAVAVDGALLVGGLGAYVLAPG